MYMCVYIYIYIYIYVHIDMRDAPTDDFLSTPFHSVPLALFSFFAQAIKELRTGDTAQAINEARKLREEAEMCVAYFSSILLYYNK